MAQRGILAYGAYLPFQRLDRKAISATLGAGGGKGTRTVASYDEDTTSLGVEASRRALRALPSDAPRPTALYFATSDPAYLEKSNAATVHAALGLDSSVVAYDFGGAVRSGVGALRAALERAEPTLVVLSDVRTGLPGGVDEAAGGDGAVAFVTAGAGPLLAELVAAAGVTEELLDRWRLPGEPAARQWEERFAEAILVEPAQAAITDALKQAGIQPGELKALSVSGTSPRAAGKVAGALGGAGATVVDDLSGTVGFTGAAHAGLLLAGALDGAAAGSVIASLSLADGADALVFRATDALASGRPSPSLGDQIAAGGSPLPYPTFLTWRGLLRREPPRRPDPVRPTAPASHRGEAWKYAFSASRCQACGRRHLPPQRGLPGVPRRRPDGARTPGRRARHDRHLHARPAGVLAASAGGGGGGRLRRRRPVPVRADRRRPGHRGHRPAGGDDLPAAVHRRGGPQLLLEGQAHHRRQEVRA